jgi:hypothetical protein
MSGDDETAEFDGGHGETHRIRHRTPRPSERRWS